MRYVKLPSLLVGLIAAIVTAGLAPIAEHARNQSPDGTIVAVAHAAPLLALIPLMPGQAGDNPGRVTIYRDGQSCGSARLDMISFFNDLRWDFDGSPREARIRLVAAWNLEDCSARVSER